MVTEKGNAEEIAALLVRFVWPATAKKQLLSKDVVVENDPQRLHFASGVIETMPGIDLRTHAGTRVTVYGTCLTVNQFEPERGAVVTSPTNTMIFPMLW